jgi:hypothetical protein
MSNYNQVSVLGLTEFTLLYISVTKNLPGDIKANLSKRSFKLFIDPYNVLVSLVKVSLASNKVFS